MKQFGFGKAVSGGTPVTEVEIREMRMADLVAFRDRFSQPTIEKTDDPVDQRIAEEIDYAKRMLEIVEGEIEQRGMPEKTMAKIDKVEDMLDDLSDIVEAKHKCEGVNAAKNSDLKRRMQRKDQNGKDPICG